MTNIHVYVDLPMICRRWPVVKTLKPVQVYQIK